MYEIYFQIFMAPSYNDKILEVVAVFSTVQLGMAIVVPDGVLQHHRIAQCRSVKITILGKNTRYFLAPNYQFAFAKNLLADKFKFHNFQKIEVG